MGYLFFSVEYPSDQQRRAFLQGIDPRFRSTTFGLYQPLPASATIDEWKELLKLLEETCPDLVMTQGLEAPRPLRPNDDNYAAFSGRQWKRYPKNSPTVAPELAGFLGKARDDGEPTPHYDHCANCTTKSSNQRCSRCKIVQYCSRDCQANHWKKCHKMSCLQAESNRTLWQALQTNDGFLVTPTECQSLSKAFKLVEINNRNHPQKYMVEGFQIYFEHVADLGGCFVL